MSKANPYHIAQLKARLVANSSKSIKGSVGSSSRYKSQPRDPFGAAMAQEIFGYHENDWDPKLDQIRIQRAEEEENEEKQLELPLMSTAELEDELMEMIGRFERGYRKMILFALKWHHLMEDLESNPQLMRQFNDIQLIRKLSGSEGV